MTGASSSCFGGRYRDVPSQNLDENNTPQTSITDCCTVVCKQTVQLQYGYACVCVCYIQFAGYTSVYVKRKIRTHLDLLSISQSGVCSSYVEINSVLLVTNDDTLSAVLPTRRGAHEKTYGIRNRRRNVYAFLEVWMLWLGCLSITTAVHGACV